MRGGGGEWKEGRRRGEEGPRNTTIGDLRRNGPEQTTQGETAAQKTKEKRPQTRAALPTIKPANEGKNKGSTSRDQATTKEIPPAANKDNPRPRSGK